MCGIAGFVGHGERGILQRMTDAIRHRGPDAEGHWQDESASVHLGHRRLAIIDLAGGAQPMWTADERIGVVFNGEIYNHAELRAELKERGCQFQTDHSDTEVLLHAYREWGDSFTARLNGMWAFVIYDRERQRLFGSRDRFGKKPLYYFFEGETFGFASELSALREHPACPRNVSELSLQKFFAYCYIPAPRTIYERVWKLPAGHQFSLELGAGRASHPRLQVTRWWSFVLESDDSLRAEQSDALCEELRAVLDRAVQRRLMSDVPLGIFLSGGIDSSAIATFAASHLPAGELRTFSVGFDDPSFDETTYARLVAQRLGTKHQEEVLDLEAAAKLAPALMQQLEEPLGDSSLLPTYLLSRFTRRHVTVALGGDGGDELFAGYDPFRALRMAERYDRLMPGRLHAGIRHLAARLPVSHANISFDFKVKRTLMGLSYPPPLWNAVWMSAVEPREMAALFQNPAPIEELYSEAIEAWDRCAQPNLVDRALQFWTDLYLQDGILAKADRASMLCSLEVRSPFLDLEVVNLARRIPASLKLHKGQTKWILKRALEPILPREIVHRKKKGFGMPIGRWLRSGTFDLQPASTAAFLKADAVSRKIAEHRAGRADHRLFLWCAWVFAQWLRK